VPRQIIDTESSRPAYQRRRLRRLVLTLLLLAVLVVACWFLLRYTWRQEGHAAGGSAVALYLYEEKGVPSGCSLGMKDAA